MSLSTILFLAVALAMDAFAVSVSSGIAITRLHIHHALRMAVFFGFFQATMPIAGWWAGRFAAEMIRAVDHWIAFGILSFVGIKMIYESFIIEKENRSRGAHMRLPELFMLAIATSIDAAAVGISMSLLQIAIIVPAVIIGVVTFFISLTGVWIGSSFGDFFGGKIEVAGGIVLIGIGVKILLEHLCFA
jgi:manganese efflux pump family protein